MGCWAEDFYSSDNTLDAIYNLTEKSSVNIDDIDLTSKYSSYTTDLLKKNIYKYYDELLEISEKKNKRWGDYTHSAVLAELTMRCGLPLTKLVKDNAIKYINKEKSDIESWDNIDKRSFFIEDFSEKLKMYSMRGGTSSFLAEKYVPDSVLLKSIISHKKSEFKI